MLTGGTGEDRRGTADNTAGGHGDGAAPLPPLPAVPGPFASDADWAAFRAAGRARRRARARAVLARALRVAPPELLRWDGTPYPDLTADPAFEPCPGAGQP